MEITPKQEQQLKKAMAQAVHDLMGGGYVDEWYYQMASDFVSVAKGWAQDLLESQPGTVAKAAGDKVWLVRVPETFSDLEVVAPTEESAIAKAKVPPVVAYQLHHEDGSEVIVPRKITP